MLHCLIDPPGLLYLTPMTHAHESLITLQDRARLRERFFGATRTVLACL